MTSSSPPIQPLPKSTSSFQEYLDIPSRTGPLVQCLDPRAHVNQFWEQNTRPDGRLFAQGRPTKVVYGMLKHSAGSALVQQQRQIVESQNDRGGSSDGSGGTKILAATTFNIGQPSPEQPDEGEVVVQVSGTGGRNVGADSRSQQQQHHWDVLQSWLQRTLEQDENMAQSLNLLTGKACLRLVISVIVLEDNGNVKDTALLACMAAWKDTRLPIIGKDLIDNGKLWWKQSGGPITSIDNSYNTSRDGESEEKGEENTSAGRDYRISLTMGIWKDPTNQTHLLADPSNLEERFLEGSITIVVSIATGKLQVDYTGKVPLTANELALASKLAIGRKSEVEFLLK